MPNDPDKESMELEVYVENLMMRLCLCQHERYRHVGDDSLDQCADDACTCNVFRDAR